MADISKEDLRKEIAAILKGADLSSTSAKKVRQELEEKLSVKLQSRKKEIDDLVMEFVSPKQDEEEEEEAEDEEEEEEEEDSEEDKKKKKKRGSTAKKPPAKKTKKGSEEDDDASEHSDDDGSEEEYSPKSKNKPIKTRKLPPKKKKGSESDSDEDWGKKKGKKGGGGGRKGGGGYTKTMNLSPELAELVGSEAMARHEVVKKIWSIIKEKDLYDPNNKQFAICDDALLKVIGVKRFRTFGMMKYLKNHFIS